jgi:hypothetical protein
MRTFVQAIPNHVALLTRSVDQAAEKLARMGFKLGQKQCFASEGTAEIYVEHEFRNSLLLIEPIGPGPYQRAIEKRGPGIHHIAIDVLNVAEFLKDIESSSWQVHPFGANHLTPTKTRYLFCPGFGALIEVQECSHLEVSRRFVTQLNVRHTLNNENQARELIHSISQGDWIVPRAGPSRLKLFDVEMDVSKLS